jgi:hypothetical protein
VKPLVILESPYGSQYPEIVERNIAYAKRCMLDSLQRGEAPIASHLLWTLPGLLDDSDPHERRKGMEAGLAWYRLADRSVVYMDHGRTFGMAFGVSRAFLHSVPVEERWLDR